MVDAMRPVDASAYVGPSPTSRRRIAIDVAVTLSGFLVALVNALFFPQVPTWGVLAVMVVGYACWLALRTWRVRSRQ
jgi:hypothetical protein